MAAIAAVAVHRWSRQRPRRAHHSSRHARRRRVGQRQRDRGENEHDAGHDQRALPEVVAQRIVARDQASGRPRRERRTAPARTVRRRWETARARARRTHRRTSCPNVASPRWRPTPLTTAPMTTPSTNRRHAARDGERQAPPPAPSRGRGCRSFGTRTPTRAARCR